MQNKQITLDYTEYNSIDLLPEKEKLLINKAIDASKYAYAPYSHFRVGCAIELGNGNFVIGNNQENSAFPSGLCAERVALFSASANFPQQPIKRIAIAATNPDGHLQAASPCGACRQVMDEYEELSKNPIEIIFLQSTDKIIVLKGVENLLPFHFEIEQK